MGASINYETRRITLEKVFGDRGTPALNAATENFAADPDFEVLGTNGSADDVTFAADGGVLLTTDGADGDGVILLPHLDTDHSLWSGLTWGSDDEVEYEAWIKLGAAITTRIVWAGLKLTNTDVIATNDDSAMIRYEDGVNSGLWQSNISVNGVDSAVSADIMADAAQHIHLRIKFDAAEVCHIFINEREANAISFAGNTVDLIPYIATEADGAIAASTLVVYGCKISRILK